MKPRILKILNFFIFLSLGLLLLFLAFRGIDFRVLVSEFRNARYFWVFLSLVFALCGFLIRAFRWRMLIEPLGFKPVFLHTVYAVIIGYMANFAFPRIGELTRCGSLKKSDNIPLDSLIGTVIVERSVDVITMILLIVAVFLARINFFGSFLKSEIFDPALTRFSGILNLNSVTWAVLIILFLTIGFTLYLLRKRFSGSDFFQRMKTILSGVGAGLKTGFTMKRRWLFICTTLLLWTAYFFMTWVVFYALPATSQLKAIDALFILVIGSIGITIPVQGGIGAFHWIVSLGLTLYGIPKEDGLAFATLSHESQALFIIIMGAVSVLILSAKQKKMGTRTGTN